MRIGVVSGWDVNDPAAWSGVVQPIMRELQSLGEVVLIDPQDPGVSILDRAAAKLSGAFGKTYLVRHALSTSLRRSSAVANELRRLARTEDRLDVIVAIAASTDILRLPESIPVIQITDASFASMQTSYFQNGDIAAISAVQGRLVDKLSSRRTDSYVVASQWSKEALINDAGVIPDTITVAPFGPGISPSRSKGDAKNEHGEDLKALVVARDWRRKGVPDVIAAVEQARKSRKISLTLVGDAPPELPASVRHLGTLSSEGLSAEYLPHDLLIEFTRGSGGGVVVTDALAHGLPVLATRIGGLETVLGQSGWLLDLDDDLIANAAEFLVQLSQAELASASEDIQTKLSSHPNWDSWRESMAAGLDSATAREAPVARDGKLKAVMITPMIPSTNGRESAGETLVFDIASAISERYDLTMLSAFGPANERSLARGTRGRNVLVRRKESAVLQLLGKMIGWRPGLAPKDLAKLRTHIAAATVIDIQWQEQAALIPWLRRINPAAPITVTLHDVLSQRFIRQAKEAKDALTSLVWKIRARLTQASEYLVMKWADHVIVLSEKDRDLLPRVAQGAEVSIVPPLIRGELLDRREKIAHRVTFVGFMARWANEEAMYWFADEVLPLVRRELPDIEVVVAGGGLRDDFVDRMDAAGIELLGFRENLDDLYRETAIVIVPLRTGAGVKYKTIEALVRGVPVVSTTVGSEGIPGDNWFWGVTDNAPEFAKLVVSGIRASQEAELRAAKAAAEASQTFGFASFRRGLPAPYQPTEVPNNE
ncbi:Glycosyltransferase involved in cell wall bisynthesis [Bowdeniella nasicola]|uniref:Glycosyltransferase involved in cell wall bisynthesis n=1 Tax=Bowdeniella nasicola TaxID=208480 RepID=A0A1H4BIH6_9ACTO|nr:glycosyltransferase [Bowdeniella nasicola]SEA47959.1 Glycosyltransferase involved in cell wall bisynthesis [Bowdeniella nasicola]